MPRRVIVVQLLQDAYNGAYDRNPFNFQHFEAQRISINMNGKSYPLESNELKMDIENDSYSTAYIMAFIQLYDSEFEDLEGLLLTQWMYEHGYFIYPVALTAGGQAP